MFLCSCLLVDHVQAPPLQFLLGIVLLFMIIMLKKNKNTQHQVNLIANFKIMIVIIIGGSRLRYFI
jgi:hypothetical protein